MADSSARIRIKLGHVEIEYEGDSSFLKKELLETVKEILQLQKSVPVGESPLPAAPAAAANSGGGGKFDHSTDTVSTLIGAKTGTDLVVAAAAHLYFVKGKEKFTRQEIIAEMRTAPSYFKESYVGNLTQSLITLTKGKDRLRLVSKDTYALSSKEKQDLEAKLADG